MPFQMPIHCSSWVSGKTPNNRLQRDASAADPSVVRHLLSRLLNTVTRSPHIGGFTRRPHSPLLVHALPSTGAPARRRACPRGRPCGTAPGPRRGARCATQDLGPEIVSGLIPGGRMIVESRARHCYYRPSPDGRRLLFGGPALRLRKIGSRLFDAICACLAETGVDTVRTMLARECPQPRRRDLLYHSTSSGRAVSNLICRSAKLERTCEIPGAEKMKSSRNLS